MGNAMYDYAIIGAGIVGVSTAMQLLQSRPGASLVVIEKENGPGLHQTGHNSGVIHAGVYYAPGSLKARFCKIGAAETVKFCAENGIAVEHSGKLIVATEESELGRLNDLADRCDKNGIAYERMDKAELKRREPNIRGLCGLLVTSTAITSYTEVCDAMQRKIETLGGEMRFGTRVVDIREEPNQVTVATDKGDVIANEAIVCAGLQADRMARLCGIEADFRIVPFRGEYFRLPSSKNDIVKHLIYPVPDPSVPFLGVHLTRMIGGFVTVGPNAVLGLSREGYPKFSFNAKDAAETLMFSGFWSMALKNMMMGMGEMWNSVYKRGYLKLCQRYCPELTLDDLSPYPAGIRAQAIMSDGSMLHDFLIRRTARTLHVCNAPSPAATSAIPIGRHIVDTILNLERAEAA